MFQLLNLKAELYRKQEACKLNRLEPNQKPITRITFKGQINISQKKRKTGTVDTNEEIIHCDPEDEMFKKSRLSLEAKARLYDEIINNKVEIDDEITENCLVDFHRKEKLGLLEKVKENQINSVVNVPQITKDVSKLQNLETEDHLNSQSKDFFSLSEKSLSVSTSKFNTVNLGDAEEDINENDDCVSGERPLHYQNVLFNEVRDHGVGYFAFSKDEKKRQEQMETINSLHEKAKESKQFKEKMQQKRNALLQSRLAKVCQRRNINKNVLESIICKPTETDNEAENFLNSDKPVSEADTGVSNANIMKPLPPHKIRPWDIGKSSNDFQNPIFPKKKSCKKSWIESQRDERINEFAPPSFYFDGN